MLTHDKSGLIALLADRLAAVPSTEAAEALVATLDPDCFTELIARSTLAGRLTRELFELLGDALDAHLAAREIRALPERTA